MSLLERSLRWLKDKRGPAMAPKSARPVDLDAVTGTIERALAAAGIDSRSGPHAGVARTIEQALASAGLVRPGAPTPVNEPGHARDPEAGVGFLDRKHASAAGSRAYKLYVPARYAEIAPAPVPLLVMLHGCTQTPDDFATGTRMNLLAERHGFLVAYPAQSAGANGHRCWNWFRAEDQRRGLGEPAIVAGIVRDIAAANRTDPARTYVAGLSAGAAMAVILGATYPDLFAAVGAHSGLPYEAAHDVPSAFAAMKSRAPSVRAPRGDAVPTIVFHGDQDRTVDPANGEAIIDELRAARAEPMSHDESGESGGRRYERRVYLDAAGRPLAEHWIVRGAGHAWSGGSAAGSYSDAQGPDASAEMVRFFAAVAAARQPDSRVSLLTHE